MSFKGHLPASPVEAALYGVVEAHSEAIHQLTLLDKLALWASWAVAAGIFLTLGWMAMAPDDPYGAVSLLLRSRATATWFQAAGLAVVASAIATILVGRTLPYAGPFAAALGLAVVSLRGRTAESLLIAARTSGLGTESLALRMSVESLAWVGVMILTFAIGAAINRWCFPRPTLRHGSATVVTGSWPAPAFAGVALIIGLVAFNILGAGMHSREIRHTQVFFVVGSSVWLGCYFAFRVMPLRGFVWYGVTVLLMALGGYFWAAMQSDPPSLPVSVPPSNYLRVLPIQFVAVGMASAIAAYWSNLHHQGGTIESEEIVTRDSERDR